MQFRYFILCILLVLCVCMLKDRILFFLFIFLLRSLCFMVALLLFTRILKVVHDGFQEFSNKVASRS